jgi:hypothetical protein
MLSGANRIASRNETKAHDERRRGSPDDPVSPTAMLLVMRSRQSVADRQIEAAVRPAIEQASWYSNGCSHPVESEHHFWFVANPAALARLPLRATCSNLD